ncbi:MAG TPA: hypothetical protein DD624_00810 [Alphaproteobacteria bacterium]|nr:hypothetical protein [Alphaproteobacteria bacterium]
MTMKRNTFLSFLLATTVLTGCAAATKSVPSLETELNYTQEVREKFNADLDWWKAYNNDELNYLANFALKNNPDMLKAAVKIQKQLATLNLSESDLFPTMTGSLGASSKKKLNDGKKSTQSFSGELALNYEIDLYGKIADARNAQEFELNATVADAESARLTVVNSVVDLYFNLLYLQNTIELTRKNIGTYSDLLNIARARFKTGKADKLEVVQARQSLIAEQTALLNTQTQAKEMEQSLRNVLNLKPADGLALGDASILKQPLLTPHLSVPVSVLANRPDLTAAQYRLKKAFSSMRAEEKNWYPTISLNGAIGSSSNRAKSTFDFPYLLGGVSLNLPFLDWNRVKSNIKIARADYDAALIDFKNALAQALNEVAYYSFAYGKTEQIYANTEKTLKNNRQITAYYRARHQAGKASFKDVLQAVADENAAQKTLLAQKYQLIKYENLLFKAMAGRY